MPIQILDANVVDQIAAGEVVERPAHLVKELVENSLDSGATEISVEFSDGGKQVVIEDNGSGISASDLPLAVARHATSKILLSDDLYRLSTYGFRGEALASIGSVSKLTIVSRTAESDMAHRLRVEFGQVHPAEETGGNIGTRVEVADLFSNVPARLKFLKSPGHESSLIKNMLKAMALANPQVTFRLKSGGELFGFYPAEPDFLKRSMAVLDEPELYAGEAQVGSMSCRVAVSSPHRTVGQSRQIWVFVQGRYVQDRALQAAVMEAYRNLLMHGEFPIAIVELRCDPADVDVNVSPNKSQVKFVNSSQAFRTVHHAVRSVLEQAPWLGTLTASPVEAQNRDDRSLFDAPSLFTVPTSVVAKSNDTVSFERGFTNTVYQKRDFSSAGLTLESVQQSVESRDTAFFRWGNLQIVGQARLTYIVCESDDGLIVVDQHAAHERVLFERLSKGYREGGMEVQQYLLPLTVTMAEEFISVLVEQKEDLAKLGLQVEQLGPSTLAVNAGPSLLSDDAIGRALQKRAQDFSESGGSFHMEKVVNDIIATAACHSTIRAGQALSHEQMKALLEQMDEFALSSFCPHGRPVYVPWTIREMERDFGRKL